MTSVALSSAALTSAPPSSAPASDAALAIGQTPGARMTTAGPAHISVRNVAVDFTHDGQRQRVLDNISIEIPKGSFVSLIGPSGCGKSTLLKILAGLVRPSEGAVSVAGLPPAEAARRRMIGLVFQDATLLPWKNALANAAFLLTTADKALTRSAAEARARDMLRLVGLEAAERKRPSQLSGGMRQRVAIARALATDPEVLLMDEPFGALDAITREEMSRSLIDIWERTGKTVVLVTHSIDEAIFLSREVHVMGIGPGRIIETLPVALPSPRGEHTFSDPGFGRAEARLRSLLIESHGKVRA
jgi:NitT/TauT family transport system ATP-binding protein